MTKLTDIQVLEMRSKHAAGTHTIEALAIEYRVSWNAARSAIKGISFQHLEMMREDAVQSEIERSQERLAAMMPAVGLMAVDPLEELMNRRAAEHPLTLPDKAQSPRGATGMGSDHVPDTNTNTQETRTDDQEDNG